MYVVLQFLSLLRVYNIVNSSLVVKFTTQLLDRLYNLILFCSVQDMHSFYITMEVKTESRSVFDWARGIVFVSMFLNILVDSRKLLPLCSVFIELN